MLDLKRVLKSKPKSHKPQQFKPLRTPWGDALAQDPDAPVLPEHPNPIFARDNFSVVNGWWEYAIVDAESPTTKNIPFPVTFDGLIRVPFSPEAPLSKVGRKVLPNQLLWYAKTLIIPPVADDSSVILHFEAVDYLCSVYANGTYLGSHQGGYDSFSFDLTQAGVLPPSGEVRIHVCVWDPNDSGVQPRGKQSLKPGNIWYTAQSGIWQSVWVERVPKTHIISCELVPQTDLASVEISAKLRGAGIITVDIRDMQGKSVFLQSAASPADVPEPLFRAVIPIENPQLWSPENPYLYSTTITFEQDVVHSYFALRRAEVRMADDGKVRFFLNNEPYFLRGVLDQGYWPEGLMTAPHDDAFVFDLVQMKAMGFNMVRKHVKQESNRYYYHCDRLGMLVWQDMISGGDPLRPWHSMTKPTLFRKSWGNFDDTSAGHQKRLGAGQKTYREQWATTTIRLINQLKNHPCIVTWVLFNEGWGQFDADAATRLVNRIDPTRPVDSVSGWYDRHCGNYLSVHNYFRPLEVYPDRIPRRLRSAIQAATGKTKRFYLRAFMLSEFGGYTFHLPGHTVLDRCYGYKEFRGLEEWQDEVRLLLMNAAHLEEAGLAGYVYTQVSDVEEETNGLLTYDRRVNKMTAEES